MINKRGELKDETEGGMDFIGGRAQLMPVHYRTPLVIFFMLKKYFSYIRMNIPFGMAKIVNTEHHLREDHFVLLQK